MNFNKLELQSRESERDRLSIVRNTNNIKSDEKIMKIPLFLVEGALLLVYIENLRQKAKNSVHQNFSFFPIKKVSPRLVRVRLFNRKSRISNCF